MEITREKAAEYSKLLAAYAEGKEVQYRWRAVCGGRWTNWLEWDREFIGSSEDQDGTETEYRIKPEPRKAREFWINRYDDKRGLSYPTKTDADSSKVTGRIECVHVREVLPEESGE